MQTSKWICALLLTTGLLSACATITPPPAAQTTAAPALSWTERAQALSRIQTWQLDGKIAVQTQQDAGSASINWTQQRRQYTVSLMGPLGSHSIKLTGKPGSVTLETADGKRINAGDAEELLAREWGFHLPVSYLNYWIRGLPVPNLPAKPTYDSANRLASLIQQGFHVQFQRYTTIDQVDLPDKLLITSSALRTKIIIYKWNLAH